MPATTLELEPARSHAPTDESHAAAATSAGTDTDHAAEWGHTGDGGRADDSAAASGAYALAAEADEAPLTEHDEAPFAETEHTQPALSHWLSEAASVCRAAATGDLEARILRIEADPETAELLHALNHLLDMTDAFVREATASLEYASQGKFFRRVLLAGMCGSFRRAAESINGATATMNRKTKDLQAAEERRLALEDEIRKTVEDVKGLADASSRIADFSQVIKRIARDTNILAINATIEAARVGEMGAGFAVVASEVKRLAGQTSDATQRIESELTMIRTATTQAVTAIEKIWEAIKAK